MNEDFKLEAKIIIDGLSGKMPDQQIEPVRAKAAEIAGILERFETGAQQARTSGNYTARGLDQRLNELTNEAESAIAVLESSTVTVLDQRISTEKKSLAPKTRQGDPVIYYLQQQELRALLRGKDPLEVETLYMEAARDGNDPALESAVENAPASFPLARPQVIDEARQIRAVRDNPEAAKLIGELQALKDTYQYFLNVARKGINRQKDADLGKLMEVATKK